MKRKVIQLAGKTFVVSLPIAWAKKYGVKKGEEVEVEENGAKLIINTSKEIEVEKKHINISGMTEMLGRVVGALYKAGYDEIELEFSTSQEFSTIQKVLNRTCIGFEIVRQREKTITTREISKLDSEQFEIVLRRLFLFLLTSADDSLNAVAKLDDELLKNIVLRDDNLNRFADFCRRVLNKTGHPKFQRTAPVYFIVEQLEKIGDSYKDLANFLIENKVKAGNETLKLYQRVNSLLRDFYELFYSFDLLKFDEFGKKRKVLVADIAKQMKKVKKEELIILSYLNTVVNQIFDMNGPLLTAFL